MLGPRHARDVFLGIFEQVRRKYKLEVVGYVVMPEHFHVLIGEPEKGTPSIVMQVLKQSVARRLLKPARKRPSNQAMLWRGRSQDAASAFLASALCDFNVYSNGEPSAVRIAKLDATREKRNTR